MTGEGEGEQRRGGNHVRQQQVAGEEGEPEASLAVVNQKASGVGQESAGGRVQSDPEGQGGAEGTVGPAVDRIAASGVRVCAGE